VQVAVTAPSSSVAVITTWNVPEAQREVVERVAERHRAAVGAIRDPREVSQRSTTVPVASVTAENVL
jgi:hypothetical protein